MNDALFCHPQTCQDHPISKEFIPKTSMEDHGGDFNNHHTLDESNKNGEHTHTHAHGLLEDHFNVSGLTILVSSDPIRCPMPQCAPGFVAYPSVAPVCRQASAASLEIVSTRVASC